MTCTFSWGKRALDALGEAAGLLPEALRRFDSSFRRVHGDEVRVREWLTRWADAPPLTTFEIYAVQPGIAADALAPGDNVSRFLSLCQGLIAAHNVNFGLICSPTGRAVAP